MGAIAAVAKKARKRLRGDGSKGWTLGSGVGDILLEGVRPPPDVTLAEFLRDRLAHTDAVEADVRMATFVKDPRKYIQSDEDLICKLFRAEEYRPYELFYKAVDVLIEGGTTYLWQWRDACEDVRASVKNGLGREDLWKTVAGVLDEALKSAEGSRDEPVRRRWPPLLGGEIVDGAYESVMNSVWSYVESGHKDRPLGMNVVVTGMTGEMPLTWSDDEINRHPNSDEVFDDIYEAPLGLLVLTSAGGWPYTGFKKEADRDVFVRREAVRVWHMVKSGIEGGPNAGTRLRADKLIVLGTSGVGKSFGCGSYLLRELLKYDPAEVPAVLYVVHGSVYIFHKTGDMAGHVVFYEDAQNFLSSVRCHRSEEECKERGIPCRGFVIFDATEKRTPLKEVSEFQWGCIAISPPNRKIYKDFYKHDGLKKVCVDCYHTIELKALFAWRERRRLGAAMSNASEWVGIERCWELVERRIEEVGPLPFCVFDHGLYLKRLKEVDAELGEAFCRGRSHCEAILDGGLSNNDDYVNALTRVVRCVSRRYEHFKGLPISAGVRAKLEAFLSS
ncbi:putative retrotransposon hot spot protein 4 (RHS4) [Trypanosoma vivax]|nr:putative retrotransposon hot spot protein 4 (RHS4) [Trypanosoma vivax]